MSEESEPRKVVSLSQTARNMRAISGHAPQIVPRFLLEFSIGVASCSEGAVELLVFLFQSCKQFEYRSCHKPEDKYQGKM